MRERHCDAINHVSNNAQGARSGYIPLPSDFQTRVAAAVNSIS